MIIVAMVGMQKPFGLVAWYSGNTSDLISEVTVCRAWLILRWVTACGQVNHLCM